MSCLNKLINHYAFHVVKLKVTLSENGRQFQSSLWKGTVQERDVVVGYSAIRHSQINPSERCLSQTSKLCRI